MKRYLVKADNGCGDHVAAVIEANSSGEALVKAVSLPSWPENWEVVVTLYDGAGTIFDGRPWLLDYEEFSHEDPSFYPNY